MKINKLVLTFVASIVFLGACTSTEEKKGSLLNDSPQIEKDVLVTTALNDQNISGSHLVTNGLPESRFSSDGLIHRLGSEFSDPANPLSKRTIYFMHDSSQVQQQFISIIAAHAQYLLSHPSQKIILEGHTDELGSREYNIALGEQRAKAVFRLMKVQGVKSQQMEIVSLGEEKPISEGMGETSWKLNRRVEIAYQVQ